MILFVNRDEQTPAKDSNKSIPLPEFDRGLKVEYFRSFPRPLSGRGPATVSSQSLSSKLIVQVSESAHVKGEKEKKEKKMIKSTSVEIELSGIVLFYRGVKDATASDIY